MLFFIITAALLLSTAWMLAYVAEQEEILEQEEMEERSAEIVLFPAQYGETGT